MSSMCDLRYSHKLIMLNISVLHKCININVTYTSSAYDGDQLASLPMFYAIRPGHPLYNIYFAAKFIGGVKIRVALRQIAGNHWLHLGPTMYLP